jgi:predicted transcriptional regulator
LSLTAGDALSTLQSMEVPLSPDLHGELDNLAAQQGRSSQTLVAEAVEDMLNYDDWLAREVEKGLATADRGELVDHQSVKKVIEKRYSP